MVLDLTNVGEEKKKEIGILVRVYDMDIIKKEKLDEKGEVKEKDDRAS